MFTPRIAWGLDIGDSSVKAVKIRRTKAGAEILAFDSIERTWPSEESGDKELHLRNALQALAARNNFQSAPVVVSIPEPAFSRFIPLPSVVDRRRIPEVVRYEAKQQIPFPIEEVVWDYQPVKEKVEIGEETEVAIFSLRSQFVYTLLTNLAACKIKPVAILPIPLALYNFMTFDRDIAKGTIVVDIGSSSTDILICDPENFRVRNITVSGNGISRALAERLKMSPAEAEQLKRECKDKVQAARLFKLIQPVLNDLVSQVQRTIGFFKSQIHNVRIEQAMLYGGTFNMPGITEFLIGQLGCDQLPSNELERLTVAEEVNSAELKKSLPSLTVALGLALRGVELGRVELNLMPPDIVFRQEVSRKRPVAAIVVALLALLFGTSLLSLKGDQNSVKSELDMQNQAIARMDQLRKLEDQYNVAKGTTASFLRSLDEPVSMSGTNQGAVVGYRATESALNAINRVLTDMSSEIIVSRMTVTPGRAKFAAKSYGGPENGPERELPAMIIRMEGILQNDDIRILRRELLDRVESTMTGARTTFSNLKYTPTSVGDTIEFGLSCDYLVTD